MITYADAARRMSDLALERGDWSGLPMPIDGLNLIIEPRYPYQLGNIGKVKEEEEDDQRYEFVNRWFSKKIRGVVVVGREKATGKSFHYFAPRQVTAMLFDTMQAAAAWLPEAEEKAMEKLADLIPKHLFHAYKMTGTFLESSKRSGLFYVFRRLRPTVALAADSKEQIRILCTLCLHPIGYYGSTWAGAMVPTDDVIAHLILMRGDEHAFWKQANQHSVWMPESNL